ncbi:AAA family ATPase [Aliarcobacter cryaerophilus]|uniref:AAA family ATPase n=1 Tax=Aliarcobacter cryaerophilus TaxID=28198 RepID=UPI0021B3BFE3|nr:AAA family ATPase [Aliarcobacter cryaerophilus]MCT7464580.1 AAA family ATPase [Aliarcobacter cryaerophilus]
MKINKLNLKNCGNFDDITYNFSEGFNIICGDNETGKTTTQTAIIDAIFGSIEKENYNLVHSNEQMEINFDITEENQHFSFSQKNNFSQIAQSGQEKKFNTRKAFEGKFIPNGVTKQFYKNIFGLNHQRLRDESKALFHNDSNITNLLFGAMSGSEILNNLSSSLEKNADNLLKTKGDEPRISYIVSKITQLKKDINDNRFDTTFYSQKSDEIKNLEEEIKNLDEKEKQLKEKQSNLTSLLSNADKYFNKIDLEEKLKNTPKLIETSEKLNAWKRDYYEYKDFQTSIITLKNEIEKNKEVLSKINVDEDILNHKEYIENLYKDLSLITDNKEKLTNLKKEIEDLKAKIQDSLKNLKIKKDFKPITADDLNKIANSKNIDKELENLIKSFELNLSNNIPTNIDTNKIDEFKTLYKNFEDNIRQIKDQIKRLEEDNNRLNQKIEKNLEDIEVSNFESFKDIKNINWKILKEQIPTINDLNDKLIAEYEKSDKEFSSCVENILSNANKFAEQKIALETIKTNDEALKKLYQKEKENEDEIKNLMSSWNFFLEYSLNIDLSIEPILTIKEFDSWNHKREQTLNQISNQKELEKYLEDIKNKIESFESEFKVLLDNLKISKTLEELKDILENAILNKASKDTLYNSINTANINLETKQVELEEQKLKLQKDLPDSLKSITLEEVLEEIEKTISYNKTKVDLEDIKIDENILDDIKKYEKKEDIDSEVKNNLKELEENETALEKNKEELNEKNIQIKDLLDKDEKISLNKQKIVSLKEQLKDLIDEYLKLKISSQVIPILINELSKENQDEIINLTKGYFKTITNGFYEDLEIENNCFVGIRKNSKSNLSVDNILAHDIYDEKIRDEKIRVAHTKMSEGTRDQLFLSLRLAFISLFNEKSEKTLPFLVDDIFINFDEDRIKSGLKLLKEFSNTTQVIFFTHSKRVEELSKNI